MRTILFDLDDTLIRTSDYYGIAVRRFTEIMIGEDLDPDVAECLLWKIDNQRIKEVGFESTRFPSSMNQAYIRMCGIVGKEVSKNVSATLFSIGTAAVEHPVQLNHGTASTLRALAQDHYQLILVSRGDYEVQHRKLELGGLLEYFEEDNIHIVRHKNVADYEVILKQHNLVPENTWVVGDSVRSEINPGLTLGLRCIHIPYRNESGFVWAHDCVQPLSTEYHILPDLGALIPFLNGLDCD